MIALSHRLMVIAGMVRERCRLADIGSDHALLPVYLASSGKITFAVAGELNQGPLLAAQRQVSQSNLQHMIDVRQGDGLAVIKQGEVDCVTIAGMGGSLIVNILENGREKLHGVSQLILQPNVGEVFVREWLLLNGWYLQEEVIITEGDHIYVVLHAVQKAEADVLNEQLYATRQMCANTSKPCTVEREQLLRFGPYLLRQPNAALITKLSREIDKLQYIYEQMEQSDHENTRQRRLQYRQDIEKMEEILHCLHMEIRSSSG